jgi:hypothetical protein
MMRKDMAKTTIKKGFLIAGAVVLFFLLGSFIAYIRIKDESKNLFINSSFKNPVGVPSIKGPTGPPPVDFSAPDSLPPQE